MTEEQIEQWEIDLLAADERTWRNRNQGVGGQGYRRAQRSQQSKTRR